MKLDVDEMHEEGGTSVAGGDRKRGLAIGQINLPQRGRGCPLLPSLFFALLNSSPSVSRKGP